MRIGLVGLIFKSLAKTLVADDSLNPKCLRQRGSAPVPFKELCNRQLDWMGDYGHSYSSQKHGGRSTEPGIYERDKTLAPVRRMHPGAALCEYVYEYDEN